MTCIAWDGKTLAADKLADMSGYAATVTKIRRCGDALLATSGELCKALEVYAWFEAGRKPEDYPAFQRTDGWVGIIAIHPDGSVWRYEGSPHPFRVEEPFFAMGSGRDYALAAMHLGFDARRAVEVACHFAPGQCGRGIDVLTLERA